MENRNENQDFNSNKLNPESVLNAAKEIGLKQVNFVKIFNLSAGRVSQVFSGQGPETLLQFHFFINSLKTRIKEKGRFTQKAIKEAKKESAKSFFRSFADKKVA